MLEKFASRHPSCVSYDDKMQFYSQVADEVGSWLSVCSHVYIMHIRMYVHTHDYTHDCSQVSVAFSSTLYIHSTYM